MRIVCLSHQHLIGVCILYILINGPNFVESKLLYLPTTNVDDGTSVIKHCGLPSIKLKYNPLIVLIPHNNSTTATDIQFNGMMIDQYSTNFMLIKHSNYTVK